MGRRKREIGPMGRNDPRHKTAIKYLRLIAKVAGQASHGQGQAEDLMGEGYLAVLRLVETFREGAGCKTLGTYIQSRLPMRLRYALREDICQPKYAYARSQRERRGVAKILSGIRSNEKQPDLDAAQRECFRKLRAMVGGLPPKMKVVVTQHFFEGKTCQEIADTQGVTRQAVNMRIQTALGLLRELMKEHR
jgi:RNA polymerase sigma factor (sigma-70 family)